jgi:hypothetical protein
MLPFFRFCQSTFHFSLSNLSPPRHMSSNAVNCSFEYMKPPVPVVNSIVLAVD